MEKIIELPDEEWNEESKFILFAWVEWLMSMPINQLRVYGKVVDVPSPGVEPESKV